MGQLLKVTMSQDDTYLIRKTEKGRAKSNQMGHRPDHDAIGTGRGRYSCASPTSHKEITL